MTAETRPGALWLVRTARNEIAGPYSREQAQKLVLDRQVAQQDELCRANGFWFYLHEREEVSSQLGIQAPTAKLEPDGEQTATDTATATVTMEQESPETGAAPSARLREISDRLDRAGTTVVTAGGRPGTPGLRPAAVERTAALKGFIFLLGAATVFGILVVLWKLKAV